MGPNVKRLIIQKMSTDAIPSGGGVLDGIAFLTNPTRMLQSTKEATEFIETAIAAVRKAVEPNPWKDSDDETIAAEILRRIEERKRHNDEAAAQAYGSIYGPRT